jgi:putative N6-adenine-specific DNA methylase
MTTLFISCSQGLEPLLVAELESLGFATARAGFRGVYLSEASMATVYAINYRSRLASRVLLPLRNFRCYDQGDLYRETSQIDWLRLIPRGCTIAIDSNVQHRQLRNSLFAAQLVKDAICDQLREKRGERPSVDLKDPDIQLNLFIHDNQATLSFDTSGSPLHKRNYRLDAGEAPLQETIAAALLAIANYNGQEVLIDPCCGSGTILIEAALIASRTAPGFLRKRWGFMRHPDFSAEEWLQVKNDADSLRQPLPIGLITGCEVNATVARYCRANLRAAGFHREVEVVRTDFREYTPRKETNLLICNPPYGKRLAEDDDEGLTPLYRALGDFMKLKLAKPGRGFVLTGNPTLAKEVGLAPKRRHPLSSGGLDTRLLEFDLY